jgi:hypothetical protein
MAIYTDRGARTSPSGKAQPTTPVGPGATQSCEPRLHTPSGLGHSIGPPPTTDARP